MPLKEHLLQNEKIIGQCNEGKYTFYASNQRVIKYKQGKRLFDSEVLHDLSYREIRGISLVEQRGHKNAAATGIMLLLIYGVFLYAQYKQLEFIYDVNSIMQVAGMIGLILLLYGIFYRKNWFEFKGPWMLQNEEERNIWRLKQINESETREFVKIVRGQLP